MADKAWKQFEREMASLIGGCRFWANSGESLDCEGPVFVAQCKHVKSMSLNKIAELAVSIKDDGVRKQRLGVVGLKTKPGRGKPSTTVVVMEASVFKELFPVPEKGV